MNIITFHFVCFPLNREVQCTPIVQQNSPHTRQINKMWVEGYSLTLPYTRPSRENASHSAVISFSLCKHRSKYWSCQMYRLQEYDCSPFRLDRPDQLLDHVWRMHYASSGAQPSELFIGQMTLLCWSHLAPHTGATSHSSSLTDPLTSAAPCEQDGVAIGINCQEHRVHIDILCVVQSSLKEHIRAFHLLKGH